MINDYLTWITASVHIQKIADKAAKFWSDTKLEVFQAQPGMKINKQKTFQYLSHLVYKMQNQK